jgi:hypothetical protein
MPIWVDGQNRNQFQMPDFVLRWCRLHQRLRNSLEKSQKDSNPGYVCSETCGNLRQSKLLPTGKWRPILNFAPRGKLSPQG